MNPWDKSKVVKISENMFLSWNDYLDLITNVAVGSLAKLGKPTAKDDDQWLVAVGSVMMFLERVQ